MEMFLLSPYDIHVGVIVFNRCLCKGKSKFFKLQPSIAIESASRFLAVHLPEKKKETNLNKCSSLQHLFLERKFKTEFQYTSLHSCTFLNLQPCRL